MNNEQEGGQIEAVPRYVELGCGAVTLTRISHEFFAFRLKFLIFIENTVALKNRLFFRR